MAVDDGTREKLSREIGMLAFRIDGERRPLLLDQVLNAGLKALRPSLPSNSYAVLRMQIVDRMVAMLENVRPPEERFELEVLRDRLEALSKAQAPEASTLTEADVQRLRTLHVYGMTVPQLAGLFGLERKDVRRIVTSKDLPVVVTARTKPAVGEQPRRVRALDLT